MILTDDDITVLIDLAIDKKELCGWFTTNQKATVEKLLDEADNRIELRPSLPYWRYKLDMEESV